MTWLVASEDTITLHVLQNTLIGILLKVETGEVHFLFWTRSFKIRSLDMTTSQSA